MSDESPFQLRIQWVGDMISPPSPVNQFSFTLDYAAGDAVPDLHLVNLGFAVPAGISSDMSQDEIRQIVQQPVPVVPVARIALTTSRLREMRDVIDAHLARLEERSQ